MKKLRKLANWRAYKGEDRGVVALIALITPHRVAFARLEHPVLRAFRIYGYKF
ncbi:MAG: hypothetical protein Q8906_01815 [Bacillota bacterium]|nr:hypothetical protein [Bacillota bacterium]